QVILSAILLGAAGLVRYDGWLYVPLFGALLWLRQRNLARSVAFCAVAAAPALFWLWVNARFAGDALAPLRHIDRDHAMLARMARFTLVAASLSLVFANDALARLRRPARALAVAAAAATPLALALMCWNRTGAIAEWARPIAPIGSLPPGIVEAARWVKANARSDDAILLDGSTYYLDIPLAFASGIPEEQWIRSAWTGDFEQRLARKTPT